jgi:hypothetical protein
LPFSAFYCQFSDFSINPRFSRYSYLIVTTELRLEKITGYETAKLSNDDELFLMDMVCNGHLKFEEKVTVSEKDLKGVTIT